MPVQSSDAEPGRISASEWSTTMVSGGIPLRLPHSRSALAFYSPDSRTCFVLLTRQIRVYTSSTRQCIRTIDLQNLHLADAFIDPVDPRIWLFSNDGLLTPISWDGPSSSQNSLSLHLSVVSVLDITPLSFYVVARDQSVLSAMHIYHIDRASLAKTLLAVIDDVVTFASSFNKHKIAFISSNHKALLFDMSPAFAAFEVTNQPTLSSTTSEEPTASPPADLVLAPETIPFSYRSAITALAVSNDSVVAIGTAAGPIQLLYGGLTSAKPQRILKWHVDQVKSLCFSADDAYLVSGGLEKVLVFWQLETGKTNFLPRLTGTIEKVSIDNNRPEHYTLLMRTSSVPSDTLHSDENYEVLVLSAIDLVSRLAVNSIRPRFANPLRSTLAKAAKRLAKSKGSINEARLRYDFSAPMEIHPVSRLAYFPHGPAIQAYDIVRNEQAFVQYAAPVIPTGKVRSETRIPDPNVTHVSFSAAGDWMCTVDTLDFADGDELMSRNEFQTSLKFWKHVGEASAGRTSPWELATKIIDPHGALTSIAGLIAAPVSIFNGVAFVTADRKGGLRLWRPRMPKEVPQFQRSAGRMELTAWTMRRARACGASSSDAVALTWSADGSVLFVAHECSVTAVDAATLQDIPETDLCIPSLAGSRIRDLKIINETLIVLSKTRLTGFNVLTGELTEMVVAVDTTLGASNMFAVDLENGLLALAINHYAPDTDALAVKSIVYVLRPDSLKPVHVYHHDQAISAIRYYNSSFVFVDADSRVGTLASASLLQGGPSLTQDMSTMLASAQASADAIARRNLPVNVGGQSPDAPEIDLDDARKVVDAHTFLSVFQHTEGVSLESLFERIVKVANS